MLSFGPPVFRVGYLVSSFVMHLFAKVPLSNVMIYLCIYNYDKGSLVILIHAETMRSVS